MSVLSFAHAALSAAAVGVVLSTLRKAGPRAVGLTAAIPISSVPALFWLWLEHGSAFAASAALGTLWGTGLTVVLGACFARLAAALHPGAAALLAWLGVATLAMATSTLPSVPVAAAVVTLCAIVVGHAVLPPLPAGDSPRRAGGRTGCMLSMAAAGAMSLLVAQLSRHVAPQLCGLVAATPVVGMFALTAGYRRGGTPLMLKVLRGYLDGMAAKAAFLGALGFAWAAGAGAWGWAIGLACAASTLLARHHFGAQGGHRSARRQPLVPATNSAVVMTSRARPSN